MYADDLAITEKSEEKLSRVVREWEEAFSEMGMKISSSKTVQMVVSNNPSHRDSTVLINQNRIQKVEKFRYLGSVINTEGTLKDDTALRIQSAWMSWKKLSGIMHDRKIRRDLKIKLYTTCIRPAMIYGSECWVVNGDCNRRLAVTEMKMLRKICGLTLLDRVQNEEILRMVGLPGIEEVLRSRRLRWFGHIQRREANSTIKRILNWEMVSNRVRGRPRKSWRKQIDEDLRSRGITADMALNRELWRTRTGPTP